MGGWEYEPSQVPDVDLLEAIRLLLPSIQLVEPDELRVKNHHFASLSVCVADFTLRNHTSDCTTAPCFNVVEPTNNNVTSQII